MKLGRWRLRAFAGHHCLTGYNVAAVVVGDGGVGDAAAAAAAVGDGGGGDVAAAVGRVAAVDRRSSKCGTRTHRHCTATYRLGRRNTGRRRTLPA